MLRFQQHCILLNPLALLVSHSIHMHRRLDSYLLLGLSGCPSLLLRRKVIGNFGPQSSILAHGRFVYVIITFIKIGFYHLNLALSRLPHRLVYLGAGLDCSTSLLVHFGILLSRC